MPRTIVHLRHAALGAAAALVLGLVSGCGVSTAPADGAKPNAPPKAATARASEPRRPSRTPPPTEAPVRGGILRLGLAHEPLTLDPSQAVDHESILLCENVFDTLVRYADGSCEIEPGLAERWDFTKDELTWVFQLRPGAKFHDGSSVNADAVAFSFQRQMNPASPYRGGETLFWNRLMRAVREIRVLDNRRVAIELRRPYAPLLAALAMPQLAIVSPEAVKQRGAGFARRPVGSGPFRWLDSSVAGTIALTANAAYWGGRPHLDGVLARAVPDPAARLLQVIRGDLDCMEDVAASDVALAEKSHLQVQRLPGLNLIYLAFNTRPTEVVVDPDRPEGAAPAEPLEPFLEARRTRGRSGVASLRIRKALARAIDKTAICTEAYGGLAFPAVAPMPPTLWGHPSGLEGHEWNPAEYDPSELIQLQAERGVKEALPDAIVAEQQLEEAGYATSFQLELATLDRSRGYLPHPRRLAQVVRQQIERSGAEVRIRVLDFDTLRRKIADSEYEACLMGWTGDMGDPESFIGSLFQQDNLDSPESSNLSYFQHDLLRFHLLEAQGVSHRSSRTMRYANAFDIMVENLPIVPLVHLLDTMVLQPRVHGLRLHPVGFRRLAKSWLDK